MLSDLKLWFSSIIFMTKTLKWWLNIARWVKHIRTWFFDENDEIWATSLENSFHSYTLQVCAVCKRFYPVSVWLNNTTKESNHPKFGSHFHSIFVSLSLSLSLSLISNLNFFFFSEFGDSMMQQRTRKLKFYFKSVVSKRRWCSITRESNSDRIWKSSSKESAKLRRPSKYLWEV